MGSDMPAPIDYEKTLRETILETLVPETEEVVGYVSEDPQLQEIGWWVSIGGFPAFFGKTFKAAIYTAKQGDWFMPKRDGTLIPLLIDWFEERAGRVDWEEVETQEQRSSRRERTVSNAELTSDELIYDSPRHPEMDTGIPITPEEMSHMLENQTDPTIIPKLKELEVLLVSGLSGYWILDDEVEKLTRITLLVEDGGWKLSFHEKVDAKSGMEMKTYIRLKHDLEWNLYSLKVYGDDLDNPLLVLKRNGDQIGLGKLVLH
jgi:hypothetical protein